MGMSERMPLLLVFKSKLLLFPASQRNPDRARWLPNWEEGLQLGLAGGLCSLDKPCMPADYVA